MHVIQDANKAWNCVVRVDDIQGDEAHIKVLDITITRWLLWEMTFVTWGLQLY